MKKIFIVILLIAFWTASVGQDKKISKTVLEKTYTIENIHQSLRNLITQTEKTLYFEDDFFNNLLKKIITDPQFTDREKVLLFYLMQKQIGYAFAGVDYLPPELSYFRHHKGKVIVYDKTRAALKGINIDPKRFLLLTDSNITSDPLLSSNALLLAFLINGEAIINKLEYYTWGEVIKRSANPDIFNHYVCIAASIFQNPAIVNNLTLNLKTFKEEELLEDVICALYSKNNPVTSIKEYVLSEKKQTNELAILTALCALYENVPEASFKISLRSLISETNEKWKIELCKKVLHNKIPYNYSLTNKEQLVLKVWNGVSATVYNDGVYILNDKITEFDPN
jgi:hypothetical protein